MGWTQWKSALRSPVGAVSATLLAMFAVLAVIAPILWGAAAEETDPAALSQGSSAEHPFGTDALGRDILLRVLVATRYSLGLALLATTVAVVCGLILGVLPTVLGRRGGRLAVAAVNLAVAFPGLLLALFFAVVFGIGARGAVLAIGMAGAPSFARLVQTNAAAVTGRDFVAAARVAGVGRGRVVFRHVLPNIGEPLVVSATVTAGSALLAFAGLSFLGLGVQPPAYDWGRLLGEGLDRIYINPSAALVPGVAVVIAGLAFTLLGESIAQVVGLRTRAGRSPQEPPTPAAAAAGKPVPGGSTAADPVIEVAGLRVSFPTPTGWVSPVDGVDLRIQRGETVGIVGESGSGKSLTALAMVRLLPEEAAAAATVHRLGTDPLLDVTEARARDVFGTRVAMVFQDPMTSLNPSMRIGHQLAEVTVVHDDESSRAARERAVDRLRQVHVPDPGRRAHQYPHEFSGGMRQRAMVAMGLMSTPELIVADEPTTALDVTVQRQVLRLLREVQRESGAAVLLISHDIGVISQTCSRIVVMYAGRIVEELPADRLMEATHPYTRALIESVPDMTTDRELPLATIPGRPPDPADRPSGCAFAPRCTFADDRCAVVPALEPVVLGADADHRSACWHPRTGPLHADRVAAGTGGTDG